MFARLVNQRFDVLPFPVHDMVDSLVIVPANELFTRLRVVPTINLLSDGFHMIQLAPSLEGSDGI